MGKLVALMNVMMDQMRIIVNTGTVYQVCIFFQSYVFTPHVCDVLGVIVLTSSVCLCVCVCLSVTTLMAKRTNIRT